MSHMYYSRFGYWDIYKLGICVLTCTLGERQWKLSATCIPLK